jgi:hypothetical protein
MSDMHPRAPRPERGEPEPNPVLAAIIERLIVPGHLLRRYHVLTPKLKWGKTSDAIRAELARGRVVRETWEGGSYITVVVPGRFRLDIEHEVGTDGLVAVDLRPIKRRQPQRKPSGKPGQKPPERRARRRRHRGGSDEGRKAA